ncbi:hypothetical protein Tco_0776130 [Tanacetum coccineum]
MPSSSTKLQFMPFKDPEREFRSSRKLFKTLSLNESRSPEFNLFSDLEENSEEEVTKTMAETMEEYMSKTRADYRSGVPRSKIDDKDHFELKGQFHKELRDNTFSGASIKTLEIQIGQMRKELQERGFRSLRSSTETSPRDHVKSISTTVEAVMTLICRIGSSQYAVSAQQNRDVIVGEPLCKASCVESRRVDEIITIHNGNDDVTYQMAQSHPRFKHLSNAQCNKIRLLLNLSMHDKLNGIWHPYQKLKIFYKGVLNLGPEYIRDAKMEEWFTRGHISVHEMEKKEAKEKV